jgi:hypothetical protein
MKFYSPKKIMEMEKKKIYDDLLDLGYSKYKAGMILSEIYSLRGEFLFKPLRLGINILCRKKDWLSKEEFEIGLENLVG